MQPTLVFFGTDEFAATVLETLIASKQYEIIGVVTQPDRPVGRKQILEATPVKNLALKNNLTVLTPSTLKPLEIQNTIPNADIFVVCVYGLIIPDAVLKKATHGALNIHPSELPKYRGPSPVQSAILNGETSTAVSIMLLDADMDHGPVLSQKKFDLQPNETSADVMTRFAKPAAELLITNIEGYLNGTIKPIPQNHELATYCKMFTREDGKITWHKTAAQEIYNQFRAFTPWPGVWTTWSGKRLKLLKISPTQITLSPGLVSTENGKIVIGTAKLAIEVHELQLEGSKPMDAKIFVSGHPTFANTVLE